MIYQGHALDILKKIPTESVFCCITNPPHYGVRDYGMPVKWKGGWKGCLGCEPSWDEYVFHLMTIFGEVYRVLNSHGTLWLVLDRHIDLGWNPVSEIIWHQPNAIPEGITNRPSRNHEYILLFSKSDNYYYKQEKKPISQYLRTVWSIPTEDYPNSHFGVLPEKLIETCILHGCPEDEMVLDPFCGTGSVGVVANRLKRDFIGIDIDPKYIEIMKNR